MKNQIKRTSGFLLGLSRSQKRWLQMLTDGAGIVLVLMVCGTISWSMPVTILMVAAAAIAAASVAMMNARGVYRAWVRYLSSSTGLELLSAAIGITLAMSVVQRIHTGDWPGAASALDVFSLVALVLIAPRLATRAVFTWAGDLEREQVAIYGAGPAGRELAAALQAGSTFNVVTFLDDNKALHGSSVMNITVRGPDFLPRALENGVTRVLLAMPRLSVGRRRRIVEKLGEHRVAVQTIPSFSDLVHGRSVVDQLRDLTALDLLGRDIVPPIRELVEHDVRNRVVLVTGAGGSIGSEIARQVQKLQASRLILLDHSEPALYQIERELRESPVASATPVNAVLGTVRDAEVMKALMQQFDVETVYHAAAYKHVPIVESNISEGVRNNLLGTWSVASAAAEAGVESFVLISTDKAVRPTNIMGATKRAAELCVQALAKVHSRTRFSIVRFGNVLDSSGSVVPLFRQQIAAGGPVTVTHADVIRYFMTIPEAAQLVIQAGAMGKDAEVFVLDMGDPVRIMDLAKRMIHLAGLEVSNDRTEGGIPIEITGLRPGEKLYEELLVDGTEKKTRHPRIHMADEPSLSLIEFTRLLEVLQRSLAAGDAVRVRQSLLEFPVQYSVPLNNAQSVQSQ